MHGNNDINFIGTWLRLIGHFYRIATSMPFDDVVKRIISLNSTSEYQQVGEWLFQEDVKYLQSPTYDMDVEDGVLSMKYAFTSGKSKKAENTDNWWVEPLDREVVLNTRTGRTVAGNALGFNWNGAGDVLQHQVVEPDEDRVWREGQERRLRAAIDRLNRADVNVGTPEVAE